MQFCDRVLVFKLTTILKSIKNGIVRSVKIGMGMGANGMGMGMGMGANAHGMSMGMCANVTCRTIY